MAKKKPETKTKELDDNASTKEVMTILETWIRAEAENTVFMIKSHPMAKKTMDIYASKVVDMLRKFISGEGLPHVNTAEDIRAQIDKANNGFWASRSNKVKRKASA